MPEAEKYPYLVVARILEHICPIGRGAVYEDPLILKLEELELGTVTGGGTQMGDNGKIEFVDVELVLANTDKALDTALSVLEALGAPVGSHCFWTDADGIEQQRPFGRAQGLALFLDGVNLEPSVYKTCSLDELNDRIDAALSKDTLGRSHDCWTGDTETALFIYGQDRHKMREALAAVRSAYPLCMNSRLEDIPVQN